METKQKKTQVVGKLIQSYMVCITLLIFTSYWCQVAKTRLARSIKLVMQLQRATLCPGLYYIFFDLR